jgi:hypothetical protein
VAPEVVPQPAAVTPATPVAAETSIEAEPERKPRRRRASPKAAAAEPDQGADGFVAAPVVDDDGAVAAS